MLHGPVWAWALIPETLVSGNLPLPPRPGRPAQSFSLIGCPRRKKETSNDCPFCLSPDCLLVRTMYFFYINELCQVFASVRDVFKEIIPGLKWAKEAPTGITLMRSLTLQALGLGCYPLPLPEVCFDDLTVKLK